MTKVAHLEHRDKFAAVLTDYHLSEEALAILKRVPLTLVVGVSSVGRDTMVSELVKTGSYYDIVTTTTRPPRSNDGVTEQDGVEYHFRDEVFMLTELQAGRLLGPAIIHEQQVSAISIAELAKAEELQKVAITDFDPRGTIDIAALKVDTTVIFVLPPSFEAWLARINKRGAPTPGELKRRLAGAVREFTLALEHDLFIFVINDNLQQAVKEVDDIVHGMHHRADETAARALAAQLRSQTEDYIRAHLG